MIWPAAYSNETDVECPSYSCTGCNGVNEIAAQDFDSARPIAAPKQGRAHIKNQAFIEIVSHEV